MALESDPVCIEIAKYTLHVETMKPISELKAFLVYKTWNKLLYVASLFLVRLVDQEKF
jgi:hypothetical protein